MARIVSVVNTVAGIASRRAFAVAHLSSAILAVHCSPTPAFSSRLEPSTFETTTAAVEMSRSKKKRAAAQRQQQQDFARKKAKLGKKATPANHTNTSVSTRQIHVPNQARPSQNPAPSSTEPPSPSIASLTALPLPDLLSRTNHHNASARVAALNALANAVRSPSSATASAAAHAAPSVLAAACTALSDASPRPRAAARSLLCATLGGGSGIHAALLPGVGAQLLSALSHARADVRADGAVAVHVALEALSAREARVGADALFARPVPPPFAALAHVAGAREFATRAAALRALRACVAGGTVASACATGSTSDRSVRSHASENGTNGDGEYKLNVRPFFYHGVPPSGRGADSGVQLLCRMGSEERHNVLARVCAAVGEGVRCGDDGNARGSEGDVRDAVVEGIWAFAGFVVALRDGGLLNGVVLEVVNSGLRDVEKWDGVAGLPIGAVVMLLEATAAAGHRRMAVRWLLEVATDNGGGLINETTAECVRKALALHSVIEESERLEADAGSEDVEQTGEKKEREGEQEGEGQGQREKADGDKDGGVRERVCDDSDGEGEDDTECLRRDIAQVIRIWVEQLTRSANGMESDALQRAATDLDGVLRYVCQEVRRDGGKRVSTWINRLLDGVPLAVVSCAHKAVLLDAVMDAVVEAHAAVRASRTPRTRPLLSAGAARVFALNVARMMWSEGVLSDVGRDGAHAVRRAAMLAAEGGVLLEDDAVSAVVRGARVRGRGGERGAAAWVAAAAVLDAVEWATIQGRGSGDGIDDHALKCLAFARGVRELTRADGAECELVVDAQLSRIESTLLCA